MWDSLLIAIATYPFSASLLLFGLSVVFLLTKKIFILQRHLAFFGLILSFIVVFTLHFRWDSFSLHFYKTQSPKKSSTRILFIGDSITNEGTRPKGFITKINSLLAVQSKVLAKSGANSAFISHILENYKDNLNFNLVFVQSGINDLMEGHSTHQIIEHQKDLHSHVKKRFPLSKLYFLPIHPILFRSDVFEQNSSLGFPENKWWNEDENFIDKYLVNDGIHLNAKAHTKLAHFIIKKIVSS